MVRVLCSTGFSVGVLKTGSKAHMESNQEWTQNNNKQILPLKLKIDACYNNNELMCCTTKMSL